MTKEGQPQAGVAGMLVREQTQHDSVASHENPKRLPLRSALEKQAAGAVPQGLQQPIERVLPQAPISRGAPKPGGELAEPRIKFKITEMADGGHHPFRSA